MLVQLKPFDQTKRLPALMAVCSTGNEKVKPSSKFCWVGTTPLSLRKDSTELARKSKRTSPSAFLHSSGMVNFFCLRRTEH